MVLPVGRTVSSAPAKRNDAPALSKRGDDFLEFLSEKDGMVESKRLFKMQFVAGTLFLVGVSMLDPARAFARDLAGTWSGKGVYAAQTFQDPVGAPLACTQVQMTFELTAQRFTFVGGGRNCETHHEKFARVDLERVGDRLYLAQQPGAKLEVGAISGGDVRVRYSTYVMEMRVRGDVLEYREVLESGTPGAAPKILFLGILK